MRYLLDTNTIVHFGATALAHQLIVVTHNTREFSRIAGLSLEDWE